MLNVMKYSIEVTKKDNLIQALKSKIIELGYTLPIDDAVKSFGEILNIPNSKINRRIMGRRFIEWEYLRRNMNNSRDEWSTFFQLNELDYCIVRLTDKHVYKETDKESDEGGNSFIILTFITLNDNGEQIDKIKQALISNFEEGVEWREVNKTNDKFQDLTQRFPSPSFNQLDFNIAREISNTDYLDILLAIKSSGGLLRRNLDDKFGSIHNYSHTIQKLVDLNLLTAEYVILCKKTSEQINKVPNKESIDLMGQHGVKCSRCNRLVSNENIEEFLTVTDLTIEMTNGSHWMTVNLVEALLNFGIPKEDILVNITEGPEEIDAVVSIGDKLLIFELKDSQFSIGHAYAFQSRLGLYEANKGVIWATDGVAPEVKEHFERVKPDAELYYIENKEDMIKILEKIISNLRWEIAERELAPLINLGFITYNIPGGIIEKLRWISEENEQTMVIKEPTNIK